MTKPDTIRTTVPPLTCFTIKEPIDEVEAVVDGRKTKVWRFQEFHFTTAGKPVTYGGVQYIPLSYFDQIRWNSKLTGSDDATDQ